MIFLDHVLLLAELAQKSKFLQNSCMAKWFHETELRRGGSIFKEKNVVFTYYRTRLGPLLFPCKDCSQPFLFRPMWVLDFSKRLSLRQFVLYFQLKFVFSSVFLSDQRRLGYWESYWAVRLVNYRHLLTIFLTTVLVCTYFWMTSLKLQILIWLFVKNHCRTFYPWLVQHHLEYNLMIECSSN